MNRALGRRLAFAWLLATGIAAAVACNGAGAGGEGAEQAVVPKTARLDRLSDRFGCDETLVAKDPEGTIALAVRVPGVLRRALGAELPYREELVAGDPGLDIRLEQGSDLNHWCTDTLDRPPRVDATWFASEGTATVTVARRLRQPAPAHAGSWRVPTSASVRLEALVLKRDRNGETLEIPSFTIEAAIGAPAGG